MLNLWNTKTKSLQVFTSIADGKVGFYACGPTVYQRAHIGNLRAYVMEDVLRRTLESIEGFEVKHVVNITDVGHLTDDADAGEDKLEKASRESGKDAWAISQEYTQRFMEDLKALNVLAPSQMPKATDHIAEQIELVKALEERGMTYATNDGIYFDTSRFPAYGLFGGQKLEEKKEGARVDANTDKKHPSDFALWKFSSINSTSQTTNVQKRQMEWESPWGIGFPGWHVECSAMSRKELGQPFDIHAGGVDHIPVHHENEIAQSEAAYGVPYVNHWMHVEFLTVDGQKMSKSIGNTFTLDHIKERGIDPFALRFFFLGAHYRSKQNFTWEALQGSAHALQKIQREVRMWNKPDTGISDLERDFRIAIENDLNTPEALAVLWKLVDSDYGTANKSASLLFMDRILGLNLSACIAKPLLVPIDIKELAEKRWNAKKIRDWEKADRFRDELAAKGWNMLDGKDTYTLEKI